MKKNSNTSKNDEFIAELYKKYLKEIFSYVYSFVHNEDDAKEMTHDVFYKLYCDINKNKVALKNPRAYLYKIARNYCIDIIRKKKLNTTELNEELQLSVPGNHNEERMVDKILVDSIINYIDTNLTEVESSVIKLKFFYKMNLEEIASVVNLSKSGVSRMIINIVEILTKEFPDIENF